MAGSVGLNVTCFFLIDLPKETKEDIQKAVDFATKLRRLVRDSIEINIATPYPGIRLYSECKIKGYINEKLDYSRLHSGVAVVSTPDFTPDEIMLYFRKIKKNLRESLAEKIKWGILSFTKQPLLFIKRKIRRYLYIVCS